MAKPVIISVRPVFKVRKGETKETEIAANRYLYAINLGAVTKMVRGGDYYLGKDGRPYYPKSKTKPKPIPVAKYFFYSSSVPVSKKQMEKLTRKDCFDAVTLTRDPKQEVVLKEAVPEYVYIVGKGGFYSGAYKHFLWGQRFPDEWITKPEGKAKELTLEDIISDVSGLSKPYRDIHIVSHANEHSWLGFSLKLLKKVKVKGRLVEKEVSKRVTYYSVKEKLKQGGLDDLSGKLGAGNRIFIRGCNVGQNTAMLNILKKVFGGKSTVYAPTHKQSFFWSEPGGKKLSWEYFHTYWLRYKGVVKKSRKQLILEFRTRYPQVKPKLWKSYTRKAKRKVISLPTKHLLRYRHPPNLNKKSCLKFAKKYWKIFFKREKQRPSEFLRREGPRNATDEDGRSYKAYEYFFKGKFFQASKKAWVNGSFSIVFEVLPKDADIFVTEKARHPNPDWFDWTMSRKNKGKMVKIQPKAQLTIYQVRKPIIGAKGKYFRAELSNRKYWGKSD